MYTKSLFYTKRKKQGPNLEGFRRMSLRAARELCYSNEVKEAILNATTENEITRALIAGRRQMGD